MRGLAHNVPAGAQLKLETDGNGTLQLEMPLDRLTR
jgi:hypothetical protein